MAGASFWLPNKKLHHLHFATTLNETLRRDCILKACVETAAWQLFRDRTYMTYLDRARRAVRRDRTPVPVLGDTVRILNESAASSPSGGYRFDIEVRPTLAADPNQSYEILVLRVHLRRAGSTVTLG